MDALERINQGISKKGFNFTVSYSDLGQEFKELYQSDGVKLSYKLKQIENGELLCLFNAWNTGDQKVYAVFSNSRPDPNTKRQIAKERKNTETLIKAEQLKISERLPSQIEEWRKTNNFALSPYAQAKKIDSLKLQELGVCVVRADKTLIIPMLDVDGKVWSIQSIYFDRDKEKFQKRFLKGARTKALTAVLPGKTDIVYIVEGFATGSAVWEALERKFQVIVSFSCQNLESAYLQYLKTASSLVLVCDWDGATFKNTGVNVGLKEALRLSNKYNLPVAVEPAGELNHDFSDIWLKDKDLAKRSLLNPLVGEGLIGMEEFAYKTKDKNLAVVPDQPMTAPIIIDSKKWIKPIYDIKTRDTGFCEIVEPEKPGGKTKHIPCYSDLRLAFDEEYSFVTHTESKTLYQFDGQKYVFIPEMAMHGFAEEHFFPKPKNNWCKEFVGSVLRYRLRPTAFFNTTKKINFQNGWLDLETLEFKNHTPNVGFKSCLNYSFDPEAKCPEFDGFLTRVFCGDKALGEMILEYLGYALSGDECWAAKALVLKGEGSNGKSTFLKMVRQLIGTENLSSAKISELKSEYSRQRLDGKLVNVAEETPKDALLDSSIFKDIVSGGVIEVRAIYGTPYDLEVRAKVIFSCNDLPHATDQSHAFSRRLLIAPFNATFTEENADPFFAEKLTKELPGIFNRALQAYFTLKKRGRFAKVEASLDEVANYQIVSNPVAAWVQDFVTVEGLDSEHTSATDEMYFDFKKWAEERGHRQVTLDNFAKSLARAVPRGLERRHRSRHLLKQYRGFRGLIKKGGTPWWPKN